MKFFVFADVHGDYAALIDGLNKAGYSAQNPEHMIISCGDMFGRADIDLRGCKKIKDFLTSECHTNKPICIFGNHEDILLNIFRRGYLLYSDYLNGENKTIYSFSENPNYNYIYTVEPEDIKKSANILEEWLLYLPFYYESKNYIFTHGFLPRSLDERFSRFKSIKDRSRWISATYSLTPNEIKKFEKEYPNGYKKTIVFGHWGTSHLRELWPDGRTGDFIWSNDKLKLIGLDCTTARSGIVEVKVIEDELLKK